MRWFAFERRWLLLVFDTLLPSGAAARLSLGARDVPLDRFVDDFLRAAPPLMRLGVRLSLWIVMFAPLFLLKRARTFGGLSEADRLLALSRLAGHPRYLVRETVTGLKAVACLGYFGMPAVQRQLGLDRVDDTPPAWAAGAERP